MELYEVRPKSAVRHRFLHRWLHAASSSLHAKILVQDRERASVGSLNQDGRSRQYNTETCIVLESPALAGQLAELFEEATDLRHAFRVELDREAPRPALSWSTEEDDETVRYGDEPMSSAWLRLWRSVLGALIPERLL